MVSPIISVEDLLKLRPLALHQFLEENQLGPNGGDRRIINYSGWAIFHAVLEDPENLTEEAIEELKKRERQAVGLMSQPADADEISSRLLNFVSGDYVVPRFKPGYFCIESFNYYPAPDLEVGDMLERNDYLKLVEDGGRPCYHIQLLNEVIKDRVAYRDILRPWGCRSYPPGLYRKPLRSWSVFRRQLADWKRFRHWQDHARTQSGEPLRVDGFEEYLLDDDTKKFLSRIFGNLPLIEDVHGTYRLFVHDFQRGSTTYTEAAKELLARYDIVRPFQFLQDPARQDQLTTWIEYVVFTLAIHYRLSGALEETLRAIDEEFNALVDAKVLGPSDTKEFLSSYNEKHAKEERFQAAARVNQAELDAGNFKVFAEMEDMGPEHHYDYPVQFWTTPAERTQKMAEAASELEAAKASLKFIWKKEELVAKFREAMEKRPIAQGNLDDHDLRKKWVLEQVPLVEAEMNDSGVADPHPDSACRDAEEEPKPAEDAEPPNGDTATRKRSRDSDGACSPSAPRGRSDSPRRKSPKHSHDGAVGEAALSQSPKKGDHGPGCSRGGPSDGAGTEQSGASGACEAGRQASAEPATLVGPATATGGGGDGGGGDGGVSPGADRPSARPSRKRGAGRAARPSAPQGPLRRSARIAARQEALKASAALKAATAPAAPEPRPRAARRQMVSQARLLLRGK